MPENWCENHRDEPSMAVEVAAGLEGQCLQDVARYLLTVSGFELALDDLICLANARNPEVARRCGKYPTMLLQKLLFLPQVAELFNTALPYGLTVASLRSALDLRNLLSHGALISFQGSRGVWQAEIAKMGLPRSKDKGQNLLRDRMWITRCDVQSRGEEIRSAKALLDEFSSLVFISGPGWPSYTVLPEGDPMKLFPKVKPATK